MGVQLLVVDAGTQGLGVGHFYEQMEVVAHAAPGDQPDAGKLGVNLQKLASVRLGQLIEDEPPLDGPRHDMIEIAPPGRIFQYACSSHERNRGAKPGRRATVKYTVPSFLCGTPVK